MDLFGRNAQGCQALVNTLDHLAGTADEDVPLAYVWSHGAQVLGREWIQMDLAASPPNDVVDLAAARLDQLVELSLENDVVPRPGAIEHDDAVLPLGHLLEQSPER